MTKNITDELEALRTAGSAVIAFVKVHKCLITTEDARNQLQKLGFEPFETEWIQREVEQTFTRHEENKNER